MALQQTPTNMSLVQRLCTWQAAAEHHALSYFGLAFKIAPLVLRKAPTITWVRAVQTWLEFPNTKTVVRVTYKRQPAFAGRRIELRVNGVNHYFGPNDYGALKAFVTPL